MSRRILLRYRYPDGRAQAAMPLHVVEERPDRVVGWLAEGTEISYWADAEGRDPRHLPLAERFTEGPGGRLGTARRHWTGGGVLRVIPLEARWQAIVFRHPDGSLANWYANLESPKERRTLPCGDALDAVDWHLDLVVSPELAPSWKDEDEADAAVGTPYLRAEDLAAARATGERIAADPAVWVGEVGDWAGWRPPADWGPLDLPDDWADDLPD